MGKASIDAKSGQKVKSKRAASAREAPAGSAILSARPQLLRRLIPALIALVTFVAFLPVFRNGFVNWDDDSHLLANRHYRGLGWAQLHWMFTTCFHGSCMPLNWVTYGLDYLLWGMNPAGYHLTSLLVHVANAVVFYFLSLRLLRLGFGASDVLPDLPIRLAAACSALFFSLHPLQVEAVAWTIGREMALAGFFFILTLICYLRAAERRSTGSSHWTWMGAAWIFYTLSLLSKEAALTLPFALLVLDVYPLRRLRGDRGRWFGPEARQVWLEKIPFLLLALAAGVRGALAKQQAGSLYPITGYGLLPRFAQVVYSLAFYPWKTLLPTALSPLYPLRPFTGLWSPPVLWSGALVVLLSVGSFIARRRWPAGLAAWLFYAVLLAPVSGIVAFGPYRADDRFGYVPCLGWAVLTGAAFFYCWQLWFRGRIRVRTLVLTQSFVALWLVGLGALTWGQTQIWHDSEALWRHALALEEKSSFAHNNLGLALARRGELEKALSHFRRAIEIEPASVETLNNLGNFLAVKGSSEEAIGYLRRALQIDPANASAHNNLGNILAGRGDLEGAVGQFNQALRSDPESANIHYNLGRALAAQGDLGGAIAQYHKALEIDPSDPDTHNNLGLLLAKEGSLDQAVEQFREAVSLDPNYAKAYFNLGNVFAEQNRLDEAAQYFQRALRIDPAVAEIHENLARVLARQGKKKEAVRELQEAVRILESRSGTSVAR